MINSKEQIIEYFKSGIKKTQDFKIGESEDMVVATLLHDIGDDLAPMNHSQYAASILRPYVSERTYWIILHHGLFQTYYSAHHLGGD